MPRTAPHIRALFRLAALSLAVPAAGCSRAPAPAVVEARPAEPPLFEDVAARAGLTFRHVLGDSGKFYIVENTAPGCAFFDFDNDDRLDIFLVQSGSSDPPAKVRSRPFCALYRNKGDGTFEDVTRGSGIDKDLGYAQGVAVGDYDNDGWDDLFISAYNGNHLLRNRGGGKFQDVTRAVGLGKAHGTGYATSAAWGDYDNDGRLDLYVCYYLKWSHALHRSCRSRDNNGLDYCSPLVHGAPSHQLLRNTPRGFVDVSQRSSIAKAKGRGLAVSWVDYNSDSRPDIFVANDLTPNRLWRNDGGGKFSDVAVETGVAYGEEGKPMAAMGIAIADYDRSGLESFYVTNFSQRPNILFKNLGGGVFEESTEAARMERLHFSFLSFGCEFLDFDADGWSDLVVNNGHVQMGEAQRGKDIPYKQRKQLLRNAGDGTFREVTGAALGGLAQEHVGRGLATGDYDNDGRLDVLAANQNAPAQLLRNQDRSNHRWVSFKLVGTKSNRNAIGARLTLRAGGARQVASVRGGSSYLSHSDRRVYFGLGRAAKIDEVTISWPSGVRQVVRGLKPNTFYILTEGKEAARPLKPR